MLRINVAALGTCLKSTFEADDLGDEEINSIPLLDKEHESKILLYDKALSCRVCAICGTALFTLNFSIYFFYKIKFLKVKQILK